MSGFTVRQFCSVISLDGEDAIVSELDRCERWFTSVNAKTRDLAARLCSDRSNIVMIEWRDVMV